jgi:putative oxidoreductase
MNNQLKIKLGRTLLITGGILNIAIAIFHVLIALIGVSAYKFFGAPVSLIQLVQNHYIFQVTIIMGGLAIAFLVAGLYGFSGAGLIRRLPALNLVLISVGLIYTLRGSFIMLIPFPNLINKIMLNYPNLLGMERPIMYQDWIFTSIALIVGLFYLVGCKLTIMPPRIQNNSL